MLQNFILLRSKLICAVPQGSSCGINIVGVLIYSIDMISQFSLLFLHSLLYFKKDRIPTDR